MLEFGAMDLRKAGRDPWVWGQVVLIALVAVVAPVMPRWVNLGGFDFALNSVGRGGCGWRVGSSLPWGSGWRCGG